MMMTEVSATAAGPNKAKLTISAVPDEKSNSHQNVENTRTMGNT